MAKLLSASDSNDNLGSPWSRNWLAGVGLFALVLVAYLRMRHAGFIWDDDLHLTKNPCVVGPLGFKAIWTTSSATYYPLVLTSFWVEHAIWELNPFLFHLFNVLMHGMSALLLWRVLLRLDVLGAWFGAALWALHPVQVESVAWITELKNTQSCFFYLLTILFFLRWRTAVRGGEKAILDYGLVVLFAVLAILSKSSTVVLPAILALCWWWRDGSWRWRNTLWLSPLLIVSAAAAAWTVWEQRFHSGASGEEWTQSGLERLAIAGKAIWFYVGKLLWPHPLIFIYPRWQIGVSQAIALWPLAAAVLLWVALWLGRDNTRLRPVFFAFTYFLIALFPVMGFFDVYFFRYSFVGDHFQYLASIGPLALISAGLVSLSGRFPGSRYVIPGIAIAVVSILAVLTWRQSANYIDSETLWRTTLAKNPDAWMAHECLGGILLRRGEKSEAMPHYQRAVELHPNDSQTQGNFAAALARDGKVDEAIPHWQASVVIDPRNSEIQNFLASALLQRGKVSEAIAHLKESLKLEPGNATTLNNLGMAISQEGRIGDAIALWQKALELQPDNVDSLSNLAWVLSTTPENSIRNGAKAVFLAERLLRVGGTNNPRILRILAAAYAENGQFREAVAVAQRGVELAGAQGNPVLGHELERNLNLYRYNSSLRDLPH